MGGSPGFHATIAEAASALRKGQSSSVELVQACLGRIDAENDRLNAVITTLRDAALVEAEARDKEAKSGQWRSLLHGIPIALKDNVDTAGIPTTLASAVCKDRLPSADAQIVTLLKDAGAIIIAKTNLSEFALTATGATSFYGPIRNPRQTDHAAGGSSGGSAAAVLSGMCLGAIGTDTGGSVRIPASWCGLVGLKPTAGLVSNSGVVPDIYLLDTCGPMGRTVEDVAIMLSAIAGYDPLDDTSIKHPVEDYVASCAVPVSGMRVGVPRDPFFDDLDAPVRNAVEAAIEVIAGLVANVRDVTLAGLGPSPLVLEAADLYSTHRERFADFKNQLQPGSRTVLQGCMDILNAPDSDSAAGQITSYIRARNEIVRRQRTIDKVFDGFDVIVLPTMKLLAPTIAASIALEAGPAPSDPRHTVNTEAFNILGLPAISVPCGFSPDGLPVGLTIAGPRFSEPVLFALAAAYERATDWHLRPLPTPYAECS